MFRFQAQAFDVYETYLNARVTPSEKLYRKLGIGGKLGELLARHDVADYFEVPHLPRMFPRLLIRRDSGVETFENC